MGFDTFYTENYDFTPLSGAPNLRFMFAASMRTGSSYLSLKLWQTGLLGAPLEYLNFDHTANIYTRLGGGDPHAYWRNLERLRSSPNGVFGFKVFVGNYKNTLMRAPELVASICSDKVIYLSRRNKVKQAISHVKALQTASWFSSVEKVKDPAYNYNAILRSYRRAVRAAREWEKVFVLTDVTPVRLTYEDYIVDPDGAVDHLLDDFGIGRGAQRNPRDLDLLERQSDSTTEDWHDRFVEEAARSGDLMA